MDLTPDVVRAVEFRGNRKSYDHADVDEFVEGVASGVEALLERAEAATVRADAADLRLTELSESEDAMRRTLVHAQRLADTVVDEARQDATKITAGAHEAKTRLLAQTRSQAESDSQEIRRDAASLHATAMRDAEVLVANARTASQAAVDEAQAARTAADADREAAAAALAAAEAEGRRTVDAAKAEAVALFERAGQDVDRNVRQEVLRLRAIRDDLTTEVAALEAWLCTEADTLRALVRDAALALEALPAVLRVRPDHTSVDLLPPWLRTADIDVEAEPAGEDHGEADAESTMDTTPEPPSIFAPPTLDAAMPDPPEQPGDGAEAGADEVSTDAPAPPPPVDGTPDDAALKTSAAPAPTGAEDEDDFLAELRAAAATLQPKLAWSDAPAPPPADTDAGRAESDAAPRADPDRARFGLRRRRV